MSTHPETLCYFAVVPAAGVGKRMQSEIPKQYLTLQGKTVLEHTIGRLLKVNKFECIVVPVSASDNAWRTLAILKHERIKVIEGGDTRCRSVLNGLQFLSQYSSDADWVLVHDVARPCINLTDIQQLMQQLIDSDIGGILAVPASDTIKRVDEHLSVSGTVDRSRLWHAQTPQMFRYRLLYDALINAIEQGHDITDEACAIELSGQQPRVVEGNRANIKITRPEDLALAEFYLQHLADY